MSTTVDQRVVSLKFDNSQFEQNVQVSLTTLDKLKQSLNLGDDAKKSFGNIEKMADNTKMSGLSAAIDNIKLKFSSLDVVATTVLANITNKVVNKAGSLIKNTLGQVVSGGIRRAQNLEQAYFKLNGIFKEVGANGKQTAAVMKDVNASVDGTAYGLDEAAVVASQFAASGIQASEAGGYMEEALRGVAGVAAMTGSDYASIGTIFATVAGNGRLMGDQLLQLSSRGLNAAASLAEYYKAMGDTARDTEEEVRDLVSKGEISFEDFAQAMNYAFGDQATKANMTFSGALSNVKASLSRIGADVATPAMQSIRRVLLEMRTFFDVMRELLSPLTKGIANIIDLISRRITQGLRSFNKSFAELKYNFADTADGVHRFETFLGTTIATVKKGDKTVKVFSKKTDRLKRTLSGMLALLDSIRIIFGMLIKIALVPFKPLISGVGLLTDGLLACSATLGDLLVIFRDKLKIASDNLDKKLDGLNKTIINLAKGFKDWFLSATGIDKLLSKFTKGLSDLTGKSNKTKNGLKPLSAVLEIIKKTFSFLTKPIELFNKDIAAGVKPGEAFKNMLDRLKDAFSFTNIISAFSKALEELSYYFGDIFDKVVGLFGGNSADVQGSLEKFSETTGEIAKNTTTSTSALEQFKATVEKVAQTIRDAVQGNLGIGEVLAVLLGVGLIYGLKKIASTLGSLTPVMSTLKNIAGSFGQLKQAIKDFRFVMIAKELTTFTLALTALVVAMTRLAELPSDQVWSAGKSIALIAGVIGAVAIALSALGGKKSGDIKQSGGSLLTAVGLIFALSNALATLAGVLIVVGGIGAKNPDILVRGLGAIILMLAAICGSLIALNRFAPEMAIGGAVIFGIAFALNQLVVALIALNLVTFDASLFGKLAALLGIVAILSGLAWALGALSRAEMTFGPKGAIAIGMLTGSLLILVVSLKILEKLNTEKVMKNIDAMSSIFIMLGLLIFMASRAGDNIAKAGAGILMMTVSLGLMIGVVKIASKLTAEEILYGTLCVGLLSIFFKGLIKATEKAGQHAARAGVALLAMSGAMVLLTACLAVISHISIGGILKGIIAINGMGVMMIALVKATEKAKITTSTAKTLTMFGVVLGVMTVSLGVLSMIKTSKLYGAVGALVSTMAAFTVMFKIINEVNINEKTIKNVVIMTAIIAGLGSVLYLLGSLPLKKTIAAATALSGTLLSVSLAMKIISDVGWNPTQSLKNMIILAAIMAAAGLFIFAISKMDVKPAHAAAIAAIGAMLIPLSVSIAILSKIGPSAAAALPAVGIVTACVLGFSAICAIIGELGGSTVSGALDKGIEVATKLGQTIGAFFGGIGKGIAESATSSLPTIGSNLSAFMENAKGFINGISSVPEGMGSNVKALADAVIKLAGAKFIDAFSNFMSWLQWPFGDTNENFKNSLISMGEGLKGFSDALGKNGLNSDAISSASEAATAIGKLFEAFPKMNGLSQIISGTTDWKSFTVEENNPLQLLGKGIKQFSDALGGDSLDSDAIKNIGPVIEAISNALSALPKTSKFKEWFSGTTDMAFVGDGDKSPLKALGKGIKQFAKQVGGIKNVEGVKMAAQACKSLATASSTISEINKIDWGNVSDFKKSAPKFGKAIKSFSDETKDLDVGKVKDAASATKNIATALKNASKVSSGDNLSSFKSMGSNLTETLNSVAQTASDKVTKVKAKIKVNAGKINTEGLGSALNSAINKVLDGVSGNNKGKGTGQKLARNVKSGISSVKGWRGLGQDAAQGYINGIKSKLSAAYSAGAAIANKAKQGNKDAQDSDSPSKEFMKLGSYAGEGYNLGIQSWFGKAKETGGNLAKGLMAAVDTANEIAINGLDNPTITPVLDLSEIQNGFGTIDNMFSRTQALSASSSFNSRITPEQSLMNNLSKEFGKMINKMDNMQTNSTIINGITYDDGSNIVNTVEQLVHAAKVERRI